MAARSLSSLLADGLLAVALPAADKPDAIRQLVAGLAASPGVTDPEVLAADIEAREAQLSTGVGEGLAMPHARSAGVTQTVAALATLAQPLDWDAIDAVPVSLVLMLAGPEADRAAHVRLLARVSRMLSAGDVRQRLAGAGSPGALAAVIEAAERAG